MRKFIITSPKFKGQAELIYNESGLLVIIDLMNTNMTPEQVHYMKQSSPLTTKHLEAGTGIAPTMTVIESDYTVTFDMFWEAYDKKINKARALPLWNKLSKTQQVMALTGVKDYNSFLKKENWRKKADPENYLRSQMWENEWK
jgi:hypothetical protein